MHPLHSSLTNDLSQTLRNARDDGREATVLIGAGASRSAGIPLASELVDLIFEKYGPRCKGLDRRSPNAYGMAMGVLTANERRSILEPYMQKARINWAHIALAQLIQEGYVSRVLSLNFDNLLTRACAIINTHPAIYDLSTGDLSGRGQIVTPSILYLHGQSYGFRRLNTKSETEEHSKRLGPIIDDVLQGGPLICLGYSGGSDGVFVNIQEMYRSDERLYWLGRDPIAPRHVEDLKAKHDHCIYGRIHDADSFMVDLGKKLCRWPPLIFRNPAKYINVIATEIVGPIEGDMVQDRTQEGESYRMPPEGASFDFIRWVGFVLKTYQDLEISQLLGYLDERDWEAICKFFPGHRSTSIHLPAEMVDFYFAALMNAGRARLIRAFPRNGRNANRDLEIAAAYFKKSLLLKDSSAAAWGNYGLALSELGRRRTGASRSRLLANSVKSYEKAVKLRPKYAKAHAGLGKAHLELHRIAVNENVQIKHLQEVKKCCLRALKLEPRLHPARNNLGLAYWYFSLIERGNSSRKHLRTAIEQFQHLVDGDYKVALYNLACCYVRMDKNAEARKFLEDCARAKSLPPLFEVKKDRDLAPLNRDGWLDGFIETHFSSDT